MRNMMVSTMSEDYVLTARGEGSARQPDHGPVRGPQRRAALGRRLRDLARVSSSSGSIVTEQVFSYPGIGRQLLQAVQNNDYALMQGIFLVITIAVLGANLVVDLLYGLIDPRTRVSG